MNLSSPYLNLTSLEPIDICLIKMGWNYKDFLHLDFIYWLIQYSSLFKGSLVDCKNKNKQGFCIKRSLFSCPVIEHFIWIEPLLRGHLSYKATFSLHNNKLIRQGKPWGEKMMIFYNINRSCFFYLRTEIFSMSRRLRKC